MLFSRFDRGLKVSLGTVGDVKGHYRREFPRAGTLQKAYVPGMDYPLIGPI